METPADIRDDGEGHVLAVWHDTLIQIWWGPATVETMATLTRITRASIAASKTPLQLLLVIEVTSPPPGPAALEEFIRYTRDVVPRLSVAVAVAEGGGFRASMMRSVAASMAMVMPSRLPYVFADSVRTGAALVAPHLPKGLGGAEALTRAVEELRTRVGPPRRA
jgi:hypothetical protein